MLLELCLLPVLSLQDPAAQEPEQPLRVAVTAPPEADPAAWLPAETLLALTLQFGPNADLGGLLGRLQAMDRVGALPQLRRNLDRSLQQLGLSIDHLFQVAAGGVAIGLTGIEPGPLPQFVCVARLSAADADVRTAFRNATEGPIRAQQVFGGVYGDFFVVASSRAALDAAVLATKSGKSGGLATDEQWRSACESAPLNGTATMTLFARPAGLFDAITAVLPSQQRTGVQRAGKAFGIGEMRRAIVRLLPTAERFDVAACCSLPPGDNLLTALLGDPARIDESLALVVPSAATAFEFAGTDIGACVSRLLELVQAVEPGAAMMVSALMQQVAEKAGVDLDSAVLRGFTGQSVSFTLPNGTATLIGLASPSTFATALDKLLAAGDVPVVKTKANGVTSYRLDPSAGMPLSVEFAILGSWLCVADGDTTLTTVARQIDAPSANPRVSAAIRAKLSGTTSMLGEPSTGSIMTLRRLPGQALWTGSFGFGPVAAARTTPKAGTGSAAKSKTGAHDTTPAPRAEVDALAKAEADPTKVTAGALAKLARSTHGGVAARATWLLRQREEADAREPLAELATRSPHDEVRVLAMSAMLRVGNATNAATAISGLDDKDLRVRTLAAQMLGKLQLDSSTGPLLAMIAARAKIADVGTPTTDLQAALLALSDIAAPGQLLPAATAVDGCRAQGVGPALTWFFQSHSRDLAPADEATLLVAVLGHTESMLRRYAISRLSELRDLSTVNALEGRLGKEGPELRPLIEVALSQIRRQHSTAGGEQTTDKDVEQGPVARLQARWAAMDGQQQLMVGGIAGLCVVALVVFALVASRRRRARRGARAVDLVAPSDEYLEDLEAESQALADAADDLIEDAAEADDVVVDEFEGDEFGAADDDAVYEEEEAYRG
ncbi:MAG: HEAT repeat domain-containing protein [Planctomycetes bacterium]|nr:HEAT repeat domain-containing protein [Planctomycetota bacterium]